MNTQLTRQFAIVHQGDPGLDARRVTKLLGQSEKLHFRPRPEIAGGNVQHAQGR